MVKPRSFADRNLLVMIYYEGPWEKLGNFAMGLREDNTLRWEIPADPTGWRKALGDFADWAERRDALWRAKYVIRRKNPRKRWERRVQ